MSERKEETEQSKGLNKKSHHAMILIPVVVFLAFICFIMIFSFRGEVKKAVTDTTISSESFGNLTDSFEGVLEENLCAKNEFINLNGLTTRVLGINSLNDLQRLKGGQLSGFENIAYPSENAASVIELNDFLNERGIDFVYLLAPHKNAFYDVSFAPGYGSELKQGYDTMIHTLDTAGVAAIDMNAWFEENGWTMDAVYFKTENHWLPQAALAAARETMKLLFEQNSIGSYDAHLLEDESYDIEIKENLSLGNYGKRVGIYYVGTDDISVYFPDFATDYSYAELSSDTGEWTYFNSPLALDVIAAKDYFGSSAYCVYMYGNKPLQIVTNSEAKIEKKLLVMGDSFKMPYEYFMTTQFKEVYITDLRYYTDGTLAEYIEEIQPDVIVMCTNSVSSGALYNFGLEEYLSNLNTVSSDDAEVYIPGDTIIEAGDNDENNFFVLCDNLEPGQAYTLTLDSVSCSGGETRFVQMTLYDLSGNKSICSRYFDVNSGENQKWLFTTPEDVIGNYAIYLFAGTEGSSENLSVEIVNPKLRKGFYEE